jgi:hypothetical protein
VAPDDVDPVGMSAATTTLVKGNAFGPARAYTQGPGLEGRP